MVLPRADLVSCTLPSTPIFLLLPSDYAPPSTFPGSYRRSPRPQLARLSPRSWPLGRRFRGQIYLAHIGLPCITRHICTHDNQSIGAYSYLFRAFHVLKPPYLPFTTFAIFVITIIGLHHSRWNFAHSVSIFPARSLNNIA